jgi:transposase
MFERERIAEGIMEPIVKEKTVEVEARAKRRRHTLAYKLKVLETVAGLRSQGNGAIGAYLRREGLYYSSVRKWEQLHSEGKLTSSGRGAKQKSRENLLAENKRLRRQNEQLENRLKKTELIVELQKKLAQALQIQETPEKQGEQ